MNRFAWIAAALLTLGPVQAAQPTTGSPAEAGAPLVVQAAEGFTVELAAGSPLTERPIVGALDDQGRLYVAESSGSNDPVEQQLAERPHRVVRLEDSDGDGRYDKRVVFAERMMFPEGAMWLDGSLYVAAPPSIWRLTDHDDDGVADERVEWFQGKTLTGCANDLHGPYAGPDGWIYWCKGAFAEQTHEVHGRPWTSRAAHIWRCRPDGSGLEPVMTGGMDNPVDVTFTREGERIFSATFLQGDGRQDGLAHAVYGGVFGKEHGVLDGHPRTGELMPAIEYLDAAAPSGLERYDGATFGEDFQDNLLLCEFNMRRVSRHVLSPVGSSFSSESSPLVWSEHVDFHPTDVLVDADGSVLVFDTGGWYKLCCPTSQLWKPEVLGGIYRLRRNGAQPPADPRGLKLSWAGATPEELWARLADARPAVRQRAVRQFAAGRGSAAMNELLQRQARRETMRLLSSAGNGDLPGSADEETAAAARTWALVRIENGASRSMLRRLLEHEDAGIRHIALQAASLHRDAEAAPTLRRILAADAPPCQRVAAEALGRIGDLAAVPTLLAAAATADDRALRHSITYALIELANPELTRAGLASNSPRTRAAALVALDQMPGGGVESREVIPLLSADDPDLQQAAKWLVRRHAEWGEDVAGWFRGQLAENRETPLAAQELQDMLLPFAESAAVQAVLGECAADSRAAKGSRMIALRVMSAAKVAEPPTPWPAALAAVIGQRDPELVPMAVEVVRRLPAAFDNNVELLAAVRHATDDVSQPAELRTAALAAIAGKLEQVTPAQFELIVQGLGSDSAVATRSAAVDAAAVAPLDGGQLRRLCETVKSVGPLELNRLLAAFARGNDDEIGLALVASLREASALPALRVDLLRQALAGYGPAVATELAAIESIVNVDAAAQRKRIDELLPAMASGDPRRGHVVFHSAKASCSACHRMGYAGGAVGPELSRIGEIRSERDLLEAILFPSLSFVRSYEPVVVLTLDGLAHNGTIRDETAAAYILATGPNEEIRIPREDVESMEPSTVSVMPAGLDKQLTEQELADLVAFLRSAQ